MTNAEDINGVGFVDVAQDDLFNFVCHFVVSCGLVEFESDAFILQLSCVNAKTALIMKFLTSATHHQLCYALFEKNHKRSQSVLEIYNSWKL